MDADNQVLQQKVRDYETINTLYRETRNEVSALRKQLRVKNNVIGELQASLTRYERTHLPAGETISEPCASVTVRQDKPCASVTELESVCEVWCEDMCQQQRSEMEVTDGPQAQEIFKLAAQLQEKKDEELERSEVGLHKDRQMETMHLERVKRAMAEEAHTLRGQLGATVKVCKELLARLQREEEAEEEEDSPQREHKQMTDTCKVIEQLQQENQQLKQRVAYVQSLNSQWQKYDSSREEYIRGLCLKLKESSVAAVSSFSSTVLHQEIARLNGLLEDKISQCVTLSREAEETKARDKERIQMLEQQVLIYTEDFKSERADRERAQGQVHDMKEQIRQLKQQLHKQQGTVRENRDRDIVPLCRVHIGHRMAPRRIKDTEPFVRSSSNRDQQAPGASSHQSPLWSKYAEEVLQCPRCHARFNDKEVERYFEHWEECAKL